MECGCKYGICYIHQKMDTTDLEEAIFDVVKAQLDLELNMPPTHTYYEPPHLRELIESIGYKAGWEFDLIYHISDDGSGGLIFQIDSWTDDSLYPEKKIAVRHNFLVPPASYNRDTWAAWLFDRVRDVETHEAAEFFRLDGLREFAPHHSNGEDPYRVWHVSDWKTANKSSGDD